MHRLRSLPHSTAFLVVASCFLLVPTLLLGCPSAPPEDYCGTNIPTPAVFTVINPDGGTMCDAIAATVESPDGWIVQAQPDDSGWATTCVAGFGTNCPVSQCSFQLPIVMTGQGEPGSYVATVSKPGYATAAVAVHGGVASCQADAVARASSVQVLLAPLPDAGPDASADANPTYYY
jgi:hypothetical protein